MLDISSHHSKHFSQSQHAASQCLRLHYYVKVKALKRPQAAFFVTGSHIHAGYEGIYKQIAFDSLHNNHPEYKKHIDIITKHTTDSKSNTKLAAANAYLKEFERTSEVEFDNAIWPNPTKKFNPRINKDIWIQTIKDKQEKYGRYLAIIYFLEGTTYVNLNDLLISENLASKVSY